MQRMFLQEEDCRTMTDFKESKIISTVQLKCENCGSDVYRCDGCGTYFEENNDVKCYPEGNFFIVGRHYCVDCDEKILKKGDLRKMSKEKEFLKGLK